jgi:hypothetical protein
VKESSGYRYGYGTPISEAKVELYNGSAYGYEYGYGYTLLKTKYTDVNGVADFGKVNIESGKVKVSKEGYEDGVQYVSSYNRNVTVYLTSHSQILNPVGTTVPLENCSGNYSLRVWPSEAATERCTGSNGAIIPSTGENAADWFNYGGCGGWKTYNVTPGSQVKIYGYSDSCPGCILWHINYYLHDYYNSTWHKVGYVDGPDEPGSTYDFCYTPKGNRMNIEAETGFYVKVFKKS